MSRAVVVQGEASESDDDEPEIVASLTASQTVDSRFGVRVMGEASESEDEEAVDDDLPPLIIDQTAKSDQSESTWYVKGESDDVDDLSQVRSDQPKYDTLLHKKLKEKNAQFHKRTIDTAAQMYLSAAKNVSNTTQQLWKLQTTVQDISHHMRSLTNDLFYLEDRIDIIATCNLLPTINI